jgi:hypothetical protein
VVDDGGRKDTTMRASREMKVEETTTKVMGDGGKVDTKVDTSIFLRERGWWQMAE